MKEGWGKQQQPNIDGLSPESLFSLNIYVNTGETSFTILS